MAFQRLLFLKTVRPDRALPMAQVFVGACMGDAFLITPPLDFAKVVKDESQVASPLLLCSMPGFDASSKVDTLARTTQKQYKSIAMGSSDGYELAEKMVTAAAKAGSWVLLKNIHLATE